MSQNMRKVLGLPQKINCFLDKKQRVAHPITMRNFPEFIEAFSELNTDHLWVNYILGEEAQKAMLKILEMTFVGEKDVDSLLDQINAGNWEEILTLVMEMNGIERRKPAEEGNAQGEK